MQARGSRDEALRFLFGRIDYERGPGIPYRSRSFKLARMRELMERLGNPQDRLPALHVAGTKGKGSTAALLDASLRAAGYRTGLYTSPHLERLEERIQVAGQPCGAEELVELLNQIRPHVEQMDRAGPDLAGPTYFEITTAAAFLHFAGQALDLAVLEVGLGGRLDSTNVCRPLVATITSISLDHTEQLGGTLAEIAREKAGIIKAGVPVVSGVPRGPAAKVIQEVAGRQGARCIALGQHFDYDYEPPSASDWHRGGGKLSYRTLERGDDESDIGATDDGHNSMRHVVLGMRGRHQAVNGATALATLGELRRLGWDISEEAIRAGFATASCPARAELFAGDPDVLVDAAHNVASAEALVEVLREAPHENRRLIFSGSRDKDVPGMLAVLLPQFKEVVLTRFATNPRSCDPEQLGEQARHWRSVRQADLQVVVEPSPREAWQRYAARPEPGLLCITGSFFIAAELRPCVLARSAPLLSQPPVNERAKHL